jgi:hypothetical protein
MPGFRQKLDLLNNHRVSLGGSQRLRPFTFGMAMSTLPSLIVTLDGPC